MFTLYSTVSHMPHLEWFARLHRGLWCAWNEMWKAADSLFRHVGIWVCGVGWGGSFLTIKPLLAKPFLSTSFPLSSSLIIQLSPLPPLWTCPNLPRHLECVAATNGPPHRTSSKDEKQKQNPDMTHQSPFWVFTRKIWSQFAKKKSAFRVQWGIAMLWNPLVSLADE